MGPGDAADAADVAGGRSASPLREEDAVASLGSRSRGPSPSPTAHGTFHAVHFAKPEVILNH